jgi:hypothetical protein
MQSSERTVPGAGSQAFPTLPNHYFPAWSDAVPRDAALDGTVSVEVV